MLTLELECGVCTSTFTINMTEDAYEDTAWLMAQRFMNGHSISCNYATPMSPVSTDEDDVEPGN